MPLQHPSRGPPERFQSHPGATLSATKVRFIVFYFLLLICKMSQTNSDDSMEGEHEEFKQDEALCILDIARVQFKMRRLEQALAEAKLEETITLGNLYKRQACEAEKRLESTEFDLGHVQNTIQNSGSSLCDIPNKHQHTSNSSVDMTGTWSQIAIDMTF